VWLGCHAAADVCEANLPLLSCLAAAQCAHTSCTMRSHLMRHALTPHALCAHTSCTMRSHLMHHAHTSCTMRSHLMHHAHTSCTMRSHLMHHAQGWELAVPRVRPVRCAHPCGGGLWPPPATCAGAGAPGAAGGCRPHGGLIARCWRVQSCQRRGLKRCMTELVLHITVTPSLRKPPLHTLYSHHLHYATPHEPWNKRAS